MNTQDYINLMKSLLEMAKEQAKKRYGIESTEADFFCFGIDTAIDKIEASAFLLNNLNTYGKEA